MTWRSRSEVGMGSGRGTYFSLVTVGRASVELVLNGQIYRGVSSAHPEIGHHVIDPSGPLCSCGSGC
jgi:glucokinase